MKKKSEKSYPKKVWYFLWHDDSPKALIAQILVAFLFIKYVFYPLIGLVAGTPLPIVAVVSGSMEQTGDVLCGVPAQEDWWSTCGEWYEERGITQEQFSEFSFPNGFNTGDVIALRGTNTQDLEVGDVIVYMANKQYPIIHRVTNISEGTVQTKGDNNPHPIQEYVLTDGHILYNCYQEENGRVILSPCTPSSKPVGPDTPGAIALLDETQVHEDMIIGKAYARIPWIGYLKIGFVNLLEFIGLESVAQRI